MGCVVSTNRKDEYVKARVFPMQAERSQPQFPTVHVSERHRLGLRDQSIKSPNSTTKGIQDQFGI